MRLMFVYQSYIILLLPALELSPVFILLLIYQQHWFLRRKIAQADGGSTGLRPIKDVSFLGHRLRSLRGRRIGPHCICANRCLSLGFQQLLLVIDHILWKVRGQFIVMFECDGSRWASCLAIATEDTAQQIYVKD